MPKRKDKKYWEDRARKAERSAITARKKGDAYKEGLQEGLRIARKD